MAVLTVLRQRFLVGGGRPRYALGHDGTQFALQPRPLGTVVATARGDQIQYVLFEFVRRSTIFRFRLEHREDLVSYFILDSLHLFSLVGLQLEDPDGMSHVPNPRRGLLWFVLFFDRLWLRPWLYFFSLSSFGRRGGTRRTQYRMRLTWHVRRRPGGGQRRVPVIGAQRSLPTRKVSFLDGGRCRVVP